jgi:hypothetical protein
MDVLQMVCDANDKQVCEWTHSRDHYLGTAEISESSLATMKSYKSRLLSDGCFILLESV